MITLSKFIAELIKIKIAEEGNGDLPVVIADWGEHYRGPSSTEAENIKIALVFQGRNLPRIRAVVIGDDN